MVCLNCVCNSKKSPRNVLALKCCARLCSTHPAMLQGKGRGRGRILSTSSRKQMSCTWLPHTSAYPHILMSSARVWCVPVLSVRATVQTPTLHYTTLHYPALPCPGALTLLQLAAHRSHTHTHTHTHTLLTYQHQHHALHVNTQQHEVKLIISSYTALT